MAQFETADFSKWKDFNVVESLHHLAKFAWIYDFQLTKIFTSNVLKKIPLEWLDPLLTVTNEELNNIPNGFYKDEWPSSLKNFIATSIKCSQIRLMKPGESKRFSNVVLPECLKRGMNLKKQVEVQNTTYLAAEICRQTGCSTVLDIGSGLGYLDQVLHYGYGYTVIGLESVEVRSHSALKRISKGSCQYNMHHITQEVTDNEKSLQELLENLPSRVSCKCGSQNTSVDILEENRKKIVMIGLHSCGDLLPAMIKHFLALQNVKAIVAIGCCYHHMSFRKNECDNFPMSKQVKNDLISTQKSYPEWIPSKFGLRLAAQETKARWGAQTEQKHLEHSQHVLFRGVVQAFIENENIEWKKIKRHITKTEDMSSFKTFADKVLKKLDCEDADKKEKLLNYYNMYEPLRSQVEILTLLQVLLQPVWEALIILDRMHFLNENNIHVKAVAVFDEIISPRNIAIIGIK